MTQPNEPRTPINDPSLLIQGFDDLAIHLSQGQPPATTATNAALPSNLERPTPAASPTLSVAEMMQQVPPLPPSPIRAEGNVARVDAAQPTLSTRNAVALKVQQMRTAFERPAAQQPITQQPMAQQSVAVQKTRELAVAQRVQESVNVERTRDPAAEVAPAIQREVFHPHERFYSDPRDDVLLKWAEDAMPWWHFDVEARMVEHETLWIMEKLEEIAKKYLKPVWWDRLVEGINDFFGTIYKEVVQPVMSLVTVPLAALAELLPDIDWPWNFELRGAHVSVKQTPFRRIVFDNRISQELVDRLWADPDAFIDAGQSLKRDDRTTVARVPLRAPGSTGRFPTPATGVLKRFHMRDLGHTLSHMLWFTRASRAWVYGREMLEEDIETARPLAMVEDRVGPFRFRSFVLTEFIEGLRLDHFLERTSLTTRELDQLAAQFAHIWHTLGEMRIGHGDMKASNFIVTPDRQLKIIDLDGTWRHWFDVTFLPRRDRDWLRFMKNWKGRPEVSAAFRAAVARHFDDVAASHRPVAVPASLRLQRAA